MRDSRSVTSRQLADAINLVCDQSDHWRDAVHDPDIVSPRSVASAESKYVECKKSDCVYRKALVG